MSFHELFTTKVRGSGLRVGLWARVRARVRVRLSSQTLSNSAPSREMLRFGACQTQVQDQTSSCSASVSNLGSGSRYLIHILL